MIDLRRFLLSLISFVFLVHFTPFECIKQITSSVHAQTTPVVISDTTFNPADWFVQESSEFGASQTNMQALTGGNPGAFRSMQHILPTPPSPLDLGLIEVLHIYISEEASYDPATQGAIERIDYSEDTALLSLPYAQAFVRSFLAVVQDGNAYRSASPLFVIGTTSWTNGSIIGLTANDFVALDGSNSKPDFSESGQSIMVGFWRNHSRVGDIPVPYNQNLIIEHGIDNFSVTIHREPAAGNRPPIAEDDDLLYRGLFDDLASPDYYVLNNDFDPDGDEIRIVSVGEPVSGSISGFTDSVVTYIANLNPFSLANSGETDFFTYQVTDGIDTSQALVTMFFCNCPYVCVLAGVEDPRDFTSPANAQKLDQTNTATDTLDIELLRRFRDEVLMPTETGSLFVDIYYENAPELILLILFDRPDIGNQAISMAEMLQDPLRNLLDGDGSEVVTQALVDTIAAFFDSLTVAVSDSLQEILNAELVAVGPLQDFVGLPVSEAVTKAIGDLLATGIGDDLPTGPTGFVLEQNFPNPFNPSTKIRFRIVERGFVNLKVFDLLGNEIASLVNEEKQAGEYEVEFSAGGGLASGIYYYQLKTGNFVETKKLVLLK